MHTLSSAAQAAIFDNLAHGIIALDANLRVTAMNSAARRFLNLVTAPVGEHTLHAFAQWPQLHEVTVALAADQGALATAELPDRYFEVRLVPVDGADGQRDGYILLLHDITARKQAEQARAQADARYRILVDSMLDGVLLLQDGAITFANQAMTDILGYTAAEFAVIGLPVVVAPEDRAWVNNVVLAPKSGDAAPTQFEARLHHQDGHTVYVQVSASTLLADSTSTVLMTVHDISERKAMELRVQQSEAYYRGLIELVPEGITLIDMEGRITYLSQRTLSLIHI